MRRFGPRRLSNPAIAFPLYLRHLGGDDINFERSKAADAALPSLHGNFIMSGWHQSAEMSIVVSGERCHLALFVFHSEGGIRERFRTGTINSDRSGLSRTNCNCSFDACFCSGRSLPGSETSAHNRQNEDESWEPHR